MMQRWKWKNILFIGLILLGVPGISLFRSKYSLGLSEYEICSNRIVSDIRIVQLTDLHNSTFGDNNADLIALVQEQNPDLILITGDQLNSGEENTSIATDSISALCQIAPVYVSLGNHEVEYQQSYNTDIKALYEQAGATVLEREYVDTEVNGQQLRIGGIYGYCLPARYLETNEADPEECAFLSEFQDTDRYTVLLTPSTFESRFMEVLTRQAPVPQESMMSPTRPITEAFSISPALSMSIFPSCLA